MKAAEVIERRSSGSPGPFDLRFVIVDFPQHSCSRALIITHKHTSYKWLYLISNRRSGGYNIKFKTNATSNPRSPVVFAIGPVNQT